MTDMLARIPFSDDSDFLAMALAPGLPMLDSRKLAYQVLLGWFGDILAEPELDDDGVSFHVQSRGERQQIAEHALATQSDLDGHLAGDYDRLQKALFDVRPVSPSERLIFNRLEPPIVNHEGFLYRVRPSGSSDRLVWCWGFQRRRSTGDVMLCPHDDCSLLFVRQDTSTDSCPRCERAIFQHVAVERRTTFPTGAVAATVMLSGLVGATYWIAAVSGDEAIDPLPALAAVTPPELDEADTSDDAVAGTDSETSNDGTAVDDGQTVATTETKEPEVADGLATLRDLPDLPERPESFANRREYGNEPLRPFAAGKEPRRLDLPAGDNSISEPQFVDRTPPEESAKPVGTAEPPEPSRPSQPEAGTSDAGSSDEALKPEVESNTEKVETQPSADELDATTDKPADASTQETPEPAREWTSEYVAAYQRAITERRFLVMLFREPLSASWEPVTLSVSLFRRRCPFRGSRPILLRGCWIIARSGICRANRGSQLSI